MQVFINEKSLHGQFTAHNVASGLQTFLQAIKTLNEVQTEKRTYSTRVFFNYEAITNEHLGTTLGNQSDIKQTFANNIKGSCKWEDEQCHDGTKTYTYNSLDYVSTSVAEITERLIRSADLNGLLLNFNSSVFNTLIRIDVQKQGCAPTQVDCSFDEDSVTEWLIAKGIIDPNAAYLATSRIPPKDYQSILKDTTLFQVTTFRNQGRKVYKRIGYNQLWVIDNFHHGADAHIEVFNEDTRVHLGTSIITAINVETKYGDANKHLN